VTCFFLKMGSQMHCARRCLLALLLPLLAGCSALDQTRRTDMTEDSPAAQAAEVLAYMHHVNGLKAGKVKRTALRNELEIMAQHVQEHRRLADRAKLAWLLTLPASGFQDAERGLDRLERIGKAAGAGALADLTDLLVTTVGQRINLYGRLRKANALHRTGQDQCLELEEKVGLRTEQDQCLQLKENVRLLEQEKADLQNKINALTNLETGIEPSNDFR